MTEDFKLCIDARGLQWKTNQTQPWRSGSFFVPHASTNLAYKFISRHWLYAPRWSVLCGVRTFLLLTQPQLWHHKIKHQLTDLQHTLVKVDPPHDNQLLLESAVSIYSTSIKEEKRKGSEKKERKGLCGWTCLPGQLS
eukprot:536173-Pelagomonas_calceolata.AAC.1